MKRILLSILVTGILLLSACGAPTLTEESELELVATAPSSYQLDVTPVYAGHDVCFLGSLGMLVKYNDPSLDFCDIVGYSGLGAGGYNTPSPKGFKFKLLSPSYWDSMVFCPRNLGYSLIVGIAKGGRIDPTPDPRFTAMVKEIVPDKQSMKVEDEAERTEYFDNEDDAFNFLKRVIASGYPVEVHLNTVLVMDDFAKVSSHWAENSANWRSADEISHYMVVTGYDRTYVYLNDPTDPGRPANLPTTIDNFKAAWNVQETMESSNTGPYWMLFIKKCQEKESIDDILAWNKQISMTTPLEIRRFSESSPRQASTSLEKKQNHTLADLRAEYAKFLKKIGKNEAAALYELSSELWRGLLESSTISDDLKEIADLEEQAQRLS